MSFSELITYEVIEGNQIWRFALMLGIIIVVMMAGKVAHYYFTNLANKRVMQKPDSVLFLFMNCLSKPISIGFFAFALQLSRYCLVFDMPETETVEGVRIVFYHGWGKIVEALWALTFAYALYRLVDIIEHYLFRMVSKTENKLDDMLVPVVRKSLRISIAIIAVLLIAENIFQADIKSLILGAGVGGIAIALAAKDTIANFFGSVTIFADKPFQIDELICVGDHLGVVEEVGFRSTKLRTLEGQQIIIPNNTVANADIKNITRRPFIRRSFSITITYDSGFDKTQRAAEIIKDVLASVIEVNQLEDKPPRVYFDEFGSHSLDIYVSYWFVPADWWIYKEVSERINFEILKRFNNENIEFAFPTQTLYLKKDDQQLNV